MGAGFGSGKARAHLMPQISLTFLTLYCFGRHGSFVPPWNMASLSFLLFSPLKYSWQARLLHLQTASSRRSNPASSVGGGSQFHWPPEVSGFLQPILAHGPRFGPRPSSIATAKGSTATAKGFLLAGATAKGSGSYIHM